MCIVPCVSVCSSIHSVFSICSLGVHPVFVLCLSYMLHISLYVYSLLTLCSSYPYSVFILFLLLYAYIPYTNLVLSRCLIYIHCPVTISLSIYYLFTIYLLSIHRLFTVYSLSTLPTLVDKAYFKAVSYMSLRSWPERNIISCYDFVEC